MVVIQLIFPKVPHIFCRNPQGKFPSFFPLPLNWGESLTPLADAPWCQKRWEGGWRLTSPPKTLQQKHLKMGGFCFSPVKKATEIPSWKAIVFGRSMSARMSMEVSNDR